MYKNYTDASRAIPDRWDKHFWDKSYSSATTWDYRWILLIVLCGLLAALMFGLIAWAAYHFLGSNNT